MISAVVTGGTGFIGKWLTDELLANNCEVTLVVLPEITDMEALPRSDRLDVVTCGLAEISRLPDLISKRGFDVFFHMAWNGSAGPLRGDVDEQLKNVAYACDAVRAARNLGCKKFVGAGSIMEDEADQYIPQEDADPSVNMIYSCAKLAAHYMCKVVANQAGIEFCWGKISNAYGEGDLTGRFVHETVKKMARGETCRFTHGRQPYDFIYVSEAAKAFYAIGEKGKAGRSYYVGTFDVRPLSDFINAMRAAVNPSARVEMGVVPYKGALLPADCFDAGALLRDTGFSAQIGFDAGIKRYLDWLVRENGL